MSARARLTTVLTAVTLALGLTLGLALGPVVGTPSAAAQPDGPAARGTFVVGDSITKHSRTTLLAMHPRWHVNGLGGRRVDRLPGILKRRLARGPAPRRVVVALGSNPSRDWTKDDYEAALAMLPATTTVLLVTMHRDPAVFPNIQHRMRFYSRWMREIAAERPRTCVFEWRLKAIRRPELLSDGVHPTPLGRRVWARGVDRELRTCATEREPKGLARAG